MKQKSSIFYPNIHDSNPNQNDKICLPFKLFHAAFNKLHSPGHSGIKISIKAFYQFYFIPYLNKGMSIFIHDCIECQQNKQIIQKIQTATYKYKHFRKLLHISTIEYQWIQKALLIHHLIKTHIFM